MPGIVDARHDLSMGALGALLGEEGPERPGHGRGGRRPVARRPFEERGAEPAQLMGDVLGERGARAPEDAPPRLVLLQAREGRRAGHALVEQRPEGEEVRPPVDGAPHELLRGHVARGAEALSGFFRRARDAEVHEARLPGAVDEHVPRRHVAVHQVEARVRVVQGLGDLAEQLRRRGRAQGPRAQQVVQRGSVHVLHGEEVGAVHDAQLVDGHDVRMAEAHQRLRFLDEERHEAGVLGQCRQDQLDHEGLFEAAHAAEPRPVDPRHAALGEELVEEVVAEGRDPRRQRRRRHGCESTRILASRALPCLRA